MRLLTSLVSALDEPTEPEPGLYLQMFFPVEGDSAIAELLWYGEQIAGVSLEGVDLEAEGSARTLHARAVVEFYGPLSSEPASNFPIDLREVIKKLEEAEQWLLENEEGRVSVDAEGLTAAGEAVSKMGATEQQRVLDRLAEEEAEDD